MDNTNVNHNYLDEHERQAKWERLFPNALYSAKQKGWLCTVCMEYGAGEYWRTIAVKEWEHPKRTFETYFNGKKHSEAAQKQVEITRILDKKGDVYTRIVMGGRVQKENNKARNRRVIKKF